MRYLTKAAMLGGALTLSATITTAQVLNLPESVILFKNVKVFDGVNETLQDTDVLVVRNKIHRVAPDIPETGDYVCTEIGHESILIVRQPDGGVRAFYNACQHRGNRLRPEGAGR